jgi:hypothetical protein
MLMKLELPRSPIEGMKMSETISANDLAAGLSDEAISLCLGWFSFGSKATVNIDPPHANLHANKAGLDELVAAGHITHEYDKRRDRHTYKGSQAASLIRTSDRAKAVVQKLLGNMG